MQENQSNNDLSSQPLKKRGSKEEVYQGIAYQTAGGLVKADLILNEKTGKVISRAKHEQGKKAYANLQNRNKKEKEIEIENDEDSNENEEEKQEIKDEIKQEIFERGVAANIQESINEPLPQPEKALQEVIEPAAKRARKNRKALIQAIPHN